MNYKFLMASLLAVTINTMTTSAYEVCIIFANNTPCGGYFISNYNNPIKRYFKNRYDAFEFVKKLNEINQYEPVGKNKTNAMKRVIALSEEEKAALDRAIVSIKDRKILVKNIQSLLTDPAQIYIQQVKQIEII